MGLLAEALVYYDQVFVDAGHAQQFAEFISWFVKRGSYADLLGLLQDGTLKIYHYAFQTAGVQKNGVYSIWNIQDEEEARTQVFERRFLGHKPLAKCLPHARQRKKLRTALDGNVIEAKASDFGPAIENARRDFDNPKRCALIIQALIDEVFPILGWGEPPEVRARVIDGSGRKQITWNVDLHQISHALGKELNLHLATPLTGAAHSNRLLWSAADLGCDLYLGAPMSSLVGDKLYESGERLDRPQRIIEQLISEVEFPDVRALVNQDKIGLSEVLDFRRHGGRFRRWLREEGERDRNAIVAYHSETAKESGWTKAGRKTLRIFGVLSGMAVGVAVGGALAGIPGAIVGELAGEGLEYVFELAAKVNEDWRPVVFGKWTQQRIENLLKEESRA